MSSKQIKIEDYFNIMRDDNGMPLDELSIILQNIREVEGEHSEGE